MSEQNKAIVLRLYNDHLNKQRLDSLSSFIAEDYMAAGSVKGPAGFGQTIEAIIKAFPDVQWEIQEMIAEGNKVFIRWNFKGTHSGIFQHIPATGKKVTNTGMAVYMLKEGKITNTTVFTDRLSFLQQLGVLQADLTQPVKSEQ